MRDKRVIIVIACAALFGLVAAILAGRYLSNVEGRSNKIVVAKVNIQLSTMITAEQLTVQQLPREATPEGAFTAPEKLIGRVTLANIGAREPLTDLKLAPEGSEAGLTAVIAEGFRAITVKVDEVVGVAGLLQPGAWVDVVAVVNPQDQSSGQGPTSKIVLQHIKVLATDQNIEKQKKDSGILSIKAVTLQVAPEQAEKLALAQAEGKLQLVMRNSVDKDDVQTAGVNKHSLLTGDRVVAVPALEAGKSTAADAAKTLARKAAPPRRRAIPPLTLPSMSSMPSMYEKPPQAGRTEKTEKPKPAPVRNAVEVFDSGKRRTIELP
jgi:pilus assembly protein CpaB